MMFAPFPQQVDVFSFFLFSLRFFHSKPVADLPLSLCCCMFLLATLLFQWVIFLSTAISQNIKDLVMKLALNPLAY